MKHAFSIIRSILIKLLAYVLCTLCKRTRIELETNGIHLTVENVTLGPECDCVTKEICHGQTENQEGLQESDPSR